MHRVLVLDNLAPEGLRLLEEADGIEFEVQTGLTGTALHDALLQCDGAICRSGVKITADSLEGNRRLKAIVRAGVGTDNIDKHAATRLGIVVMNTPAGNTLSTAEHTIAMILALSRNIAPAYQSLREGRWDRKEYMGSQVAGKTLGIVGLGRIGQAVASRARALQMRLVGFDPFLSKERAAELGVETVESVADLLPDVDYLTVHTPLNDETRGLVDRAAIERMRPDVRLINCARGGIYDEEALGWGIREGRIGGVALDVFADEPCTDSPLFGMQGVLATPHLGASTEEAQTQVATEAVGLLLDFLRSGAIRHAVNMIPLDPQTVKGLRGYLDLAYRLGLLVAGLHHRGACGCHLLYRGEIAAKETRLLTASFAAGLLQSALEAEVNIVNAEMLLRERGIEIVEECRHDMGAFSSSMTAEVTTNSGRHKVAGTLLGHDMPRLVAVDDYRLEAFLDGYLMVFHHQDIPGIIGAIGTILGSHQVNIAQMAVGRAGTTPGSEAVGVLNLDSGPPHAALAEVLGHAAIESAAVVRLPAAKELPAWLHG